MNLQPTVFLVDDDEAVRDSLSLSLEVSGFDGSRLRLRAGFSR